MSAVSNPNENLEATHCFSVTRFLRNQANQESNEFNQAEKKAAQYQNGYKMNNKRMLVHFPLVPDNVFRSHRIQLRQA